MKKILLSLMIFLSIISYSNEYKLSPAMKLDQYMLMAEKSIKEEDYKKSMDYLEKILDLKIEKLSSDFYYLYGKTAFELNDFNNSKENIHIYLDRTKRSGKYYLSALEILALCDEKKDKKDNIKTELENKNFVYVPQGSFVMGSTPKEYDEKPSHTVKLNSFFISKYETTHKEYIEFLNNKKVEENGMYMDKKLISLKDSECSISYNSKGFYFKGSDIALNPDTPVIKVSWWGAIAYCNWLSEKEGISPAYDLKTGEFIDKNGNKTNDISKVEGYRLPTEAEWEYAAKGGSTGSNTIYAGSKKADDVAWYSTLDKRLEKISEVGKKAPNELGIYDMSGNVWEWCNDWYQEEAYSKHTESNPNINTKTEWKVRRGGSWVNEPEFCRVENRFKHNPSSVGRALGFRVAKTN